MREFSPNLRLFISGHVDETKHPLVPVAEFAHYVNEMKANENYEFQSEYDVSIIIIIIIIISKLFNNGNPSAEAAFQGAVLKIIYKLTY